MSNRERCYAFLPIDLDTPRQHRAILPPRTHVHINSATQHSLPRTSIRGPHSTPTVQHLDPVKRGWDSLQRGQLWQVWQKCGRFKSQTCHRIQSWFAYHLALAVAGVAGVAEVAGIFKKLSGDSPL